jgi:hypothetical protein
MSRLMVSNDQVRIYDDFLPQKSFEPLLEWARSDWYFWLHRDIWHPAWHTGDGLPLRGTARFYRDDRAYRPHESGYPTGTPIDRLLEAINAVADSAAAVVGERGTAWNGFVLSPFLHPRGCGLSMHRDHTIYTGALTYYIHHEWDLHWGGHLLILDPRTGEGIDRHDPKLRSFLSDDNENRVISEPGLALCVPPKPNRLVIFAEDIYHMVTRVDDDAGDRPRIALAGFFLRNSNHQVPAT